MPLNSPLVRAALVDGFRVPGRAPEAVRADAENAAFRVFQGDASAEMNPYQTGTQAYVLWGTSFHARLIYLEELDKLRRKVAPRAMALADSIQATRDARNGRP